MLGQHAGELGAAAGDDVDGAGRHVGIFDDLVEVGGEQRISCRRHRDHRVAHGQRRRDQRDQAEQRRIVGRDDADHADRLVQRQRHGAGRRLVDAALELVGHAGIVEQPLDRQRRPRRARPWRVAPVSCAEPRGKLVGAAGQVFGQDNRAPGCGCRRSPRPRPCRRARPRRRRECPCGCRGRLRRQACPCGRARRANSCRPAAPACRR